LRAAAWLSLLTGIFSSTMMSQSYPRCGHCAAHFLTLTMLAGGLCLWAARAQAPQPSHAAAAKSGPVITEGLGLRAATNNNIAIPRAGFGKEYILSASIIPQALSATSTGLAGKIVRFELFHDGVDLYEATQGLLVTEDLPARRLLTTFPIVEQDDQQVVIDFNKGMRRVFTDIWYGGGGFDVAGRSRSLEVPQSRVFDVRQDGDQVVIRQSAQARDRGVDPNREERYELRYFISPYAPREFKSKEHNASEARYVRFFEVQSQVEPVTGRLTTKIARFDLARPVLFYYSDNTPPDYVEAMREGILYWNRAFGKEVVKAEKAPKGVTAPDLEHNVVQWVPWDNAGFAYADVLVDPRTGSSEHGQAYMTSVFAIGGKSRARELLRLMRATIEAKETKDKGDPKAAAGGQPGLGIDFMTPSSLCSVDREAFAQQLAAGLEGMLAEGKLDDAAVLRASQDYVREVVAHEVGHVLGLRHNFAGSLAGTLTHKDLDEWFRQYVTDVKTNTFATNVTSFSVMDYNTFKASIFLGQVIHASKEALPYDKAAIQWGYYDSAEPQQKKLLFGTDDDTRAYGDVNRFDYGVEPVVGAYAVLGDTITNLPSSIIETFIRARAPRDPRDRRPLEEVNLSVGSYVSALSGALNDILVWFKASTRSLRVENAFEFVGDLDRKEIIQAHWKALGEQVEKVGGVDRLVFAFLPVDLKLELKAEPKEVRAVEKIDAKRLTDRLAKLLEAPAYTNFVGLDEKTYTFTKDEKELILKRGRKFFEEFEKAVVRSTCGVLERAQRDIGVEANKAVGDEDVVAQLEKRIIDFAKLVITAKSEDERRRGKVDKGFVEVVDFKYDLETRLAAARALGDAIGSFKGWAVDAKGDLNKQLKDDVDAALNIQNFKEFQESTLSRQLREWYLNQQAILALLPPKKPAAPR
jgi:hypothetical protein